MDEIRFVTELYYDIQKMRIMSGNRLNQLRRDGMDPQRAQVMQDWVDERLVSIEKDIKKMATKYVEEEEIWSWLNEVKGIGPVISACLISWIKPIKRFDTVSSLWAYCGQDVRDGMAPRKKKGEKVNWNPRLRTLCWKISDSFVKSKGPYRDEYDRAKAFYRAKFPDQVDTGEKTRRGTPIMQYTDLHIHNMAKRKAVKLFLSHFWVKWRELENLEIRLPYAFDRLGHRHYIQP